MVEAMFTKPNSERSKTASLLLLVFWSSSIVGSGFCGEDAEEEEGSNPFQALVVRRWFILISFDT